MPQPPRDLDGRTASDAARRRAAELLASGETAGVAADAAGVSVRTIRRWLADDVEFAAELALARRGLGEEARQRIAGRLTAAVDVLAALMGDETQPGNVRVSAAKAILERGLGPAGVDAPAADDATRAALQAAAGGREHLEALVLSKLSQALGLAPPVEPARARLAPVDVGADVVLALASDGHEGAP